MFENIMRSIISLVFCFSSYILLATDKVTFDEIRDKIVIIQCDDSTGSGFTCEMDGKRYLLTNKHVISGQKRVVAYFSDGKKLKFGAMEIAENVDLVRFLIATNHPAFNISLHEPKMQEKVKIYGNSDGKGVITEIKGKIIGIGPKELEVSAEFVQGNSGSALLNESGEVVGVATYAIKDFDPEDWVKADTRYSRVRRFALRLNDCKWKKKDLKKLYQEVKAEKKKKLKEFGIVPQTRAVFKNPSMRVNKFNNRHYINGNIVLGLSDVKAIKNPIVRVVALVQGDRMAVIDAISDKPGGVYNYSNVPIYSYGMEKSGCVYNIGNNRAVYYLEGLSFHQTARLGMQAGASKNMAYFDRSNLLTGGFSIPECIVSQHATPIGVKIIAFRFECWQNGSLAGVYNSRSPDVLNSKGVPVDWFIMGKYPGRLYYVNNCRYQSGGY